MLTTNISKIFFATLLFSQFSIAQSGIGDSLRNVGAGISEVERFAQAATEENIVPGSYTRQARYNNLADVVERAQRAGATDAEIERALARGGVRIRGSANVTTMAILAALSAAGAALASKNARADGIDDSGVVMHMRSASSGKLSSKTNPISTDSQQNNSAQSRAIAVGTK